ncbi:MAG: response regulator [Geobacter sp.]|nr:response regulator [Geobacter sp.]
MADDNLLNLKTTELILQKLGHRFVIVSNGKQAVEKWQQGSIDLILMDIQMPEMGGVEALKIIRSEELCVRHTPVVALTADALKGTEDQLLAAGFDDYLSKPVKVHVLQEAICRLIHPETVLTARP